MKAISLIVFAFALSACAGPGANEKIPPGSLKISQGAKDVLYRDGVIVSHENPYYTKDEEVVCIRRLKEGSHIYQRVCSTREEMERSAEEARLFVDSLRKAAAK